MLDTAERSAAAAEWQRLAAAPGPADRRTLGCMTMVAAIVLTLAVPPLLGWLGVQVPRPLKLAAAGLMLLLFLGGGVVGLVFGSGRFAHDARRAEEALAWLAAHGAGGDAPTRRAMAVALLYHAYCVDGPSTTSTFDFEKARARLGEALPYVMEVERVLASDLRIYRVFTDDKVRLPG